MATIHKDFLDVFNGIAPSKHRYTVFTDFVTMMAISLHNAIVKDEKLEAEYMRCIQGYKREDQLQFPKLLAIFVDISEGEPYDHFGQLFMALGFSEDRKGQFFTPPEIAEMMVRMTFIDIQEKLTQKAFVTLSEPACGAGSMLLASVKVLIQAGYNPANVLWIQAIDIDRVSALMCYIQLTLWHVPAEVIVGDALTLEYREHWFTASHYLGGWKQKLVWRKMIEHLRDLEEIKQSPVDPASSPLLIDVIPILQTEELVGIVHPAAIADMSPVLKSSRNVKVNPQFGFDF